MKHIVLFSGGANSSFVAYLVRLKQKKEDIILLHTPTYSEHPDADRFRKQISEFLEIPITVQADGRDIWKLIKDEHCLPSDRIPFCSRILKQEQSDKFYKQLKDDFTIYLGYGMNEYQRVQKNHVRLEARKIKSAYPLLYEGISDEDIKSIIMNNWKICLPEPYMYLKHNNCIPCFKGGKKHFYQIWKHYNDYFQKAKQAEIDIGYTILKDESLTQLEDKWKLQIPLFTDDDFDMRPCMCAL